MHRDLANYETMNVEWVYKFFNNIFEPRSISYHIEVYLKNTV